MKPKAYDIIKQKPKKVEIEAPFNPYKGHEYRLFLIWRSLPMEIKKGGVPYLEKAGVDDEDLLALAECRTMGDFAEKFGVSRDQLTEWKQKPVPPEFQDIDWRVWARQLTQSVVALLFEGIQEDKDAARIKLWLQAVDGYVEQSAINGNVSVETLNGVRSLVEKMNEAQVASDATDSKTGN